MIDCVEGSGGNMESCRGFDALGRGFGGGVGVCPIHPPPANKLLGSA